MLSKGEIDSNKVRVEFSLEDMDMSGFQKGATYEQIIVLANIQTALSLDLGDIQAGHLQTVLFQHILLNLFIRRKMPKCRSANQKRKRQLWRH